MENTIKYISLALAVGALAFGQSSEAQSYNDVYDALPDMTLDQAYSSLIDYQKSNPYFANTYIQLGSVCEKKMILFDPLRDNESLRFWAGNAKLFYGNLKVYYKNGDVRSEYYENLNIPYSGKKLEDDDLWNYVNEHMESCKNHCDSTTMIYNAIEQSKFYYDKCLSEYKSICEEYINFNELLLRNDAELDARLKNIGKWMDKCFDEFKEYKRLTDLYPVMNYNQFYDTKEIETFRLDGLTNSDFYANRFYVWDYRGWIDNYYSIYNKDILELRQEVAKIDDMYRQGREELENGDKQSIVLNSPYDDYFFFKLGRYDNNSLVRDLFVYLDETRQLVAMAGDSLGRNILYSNELAGRKMRHLYRMNALRNDINTYREKFVDAITANKIANFKDFFDKSYGGESGLRKFAEEDVVYCNSLIDDVADELGAYVVDADSARGAIDGVYSTKGGTVPALPLYVAADDNSVTGKYVAKHVSYGSHGSVNNVAGTLKGNARSWYVAGVSDDGVSQWLLTLKNVVSISGLQSVADGCLLCAIRQQKPVIIWVDGNGKEKYAIDCETETVDIMRCDDVRERVYWLWGNEEGAPVLCAADALGKKMWSVGISGLSKVKGVDVVSGGYIVIGVTDGGELASVVVASDGSVGEVKSVMKKVAEVVVSARASAGEFGVVVKQRDGKHKYVIISAQGELVAL